MKKFSLALGLALFGSSLAPFALAGDFSAEAGASYVRPRSFEAESTNVFGRQDRSRWAPYIAGRYVWNDWLGARLSYRHISDFRATIEYGIPPAGGVGPQVIVWGHYRDDVHQVSLAPEITFHPYAGLVLVVSPVVNWVSSRGDVSYSTNNPAVTLLAMRDRNDTGFTLGGSVQLRYALSARAAVTVGYEYVDLAPSFGRKAHVFSGGVQWTF